MKSSLWTAFWNPSPPDYPKDKLEIQILDDSTDDTTEQCYRKVEELKSRGFDARLHSPHGPHRFQGRSAGSGHQDCQGRNSC